MLKGIILAGGSGTRLYPITRGVSKQLNNYRTIASAPDGTLTYDAHTVNFKGASYWRVREKALHRLFFLAMVTALLFVSMTSDVYAYVDPVAGSFLLQGLISGLVAALVTLRSVRARIMQMFRLKKGSKGAESNELDTPT